MREVVAQPPRSQVGYGGHARLATPVPANTITPPPARARRAHRTRRRIVGTAAIIASVLIVFAAAGRLLGWFGDDAAPRRVLVTNEFAHFNPQDKHAVASPVWDVTSGSLFRWDDVLGAGEPDDRSPDAASKHGTGSAVFRAVHAGAAADATVTFSLRNEGLSSTPRTPAVAFDGVHVFLRYQSAEELYVVSVNRRDDTVAIKKKLPGGTANGGHYETLAAAYAPVRYHEWVPFRVSIVTRADDSVRIDLVSGTELLLSGFDHGQGGPPILAAGRVGLRTDNCRFELSHFEVQRD